MDLFDKDTHHFIVHKKANYLRFLNLPTIQTETITFRNGSHLAIGDLISGIGVSKTLKGHMKGFEMEDGYALEFFGSYTLPESKINYLLFKSVKLKEKSELIGIQGYFWFYCFAFTHHKLLLENSTHGFMDLNPDFIKIHREAA